MKFLATACVAVVATISAARADVAMHSFQQDVISDNTVALDGQYEMRALKLLIGPHGALGEHRHTGPGYICVTSGVLSSAMDGKTQAVHPGECVYDSGEDNHALTNEGMQNVVGFTFEVMPVRATAGEHRGQSSGTASILPPK